MLACINNSVDLRLYETTCLTSEVASSISFTWHATYYHMESSELLTITGKYFHSSETYIIHSKGNWNAHDCDIISTRTSGKITDCFLLRTIFATIQRQPRISPRHNLPWRTEFWHMLFRMQKPAFIPFPDVQICNFGTMCRLKNIYRLFKQLLMSANLFNSFKSSFSVGTGWWRWLLGLRAIGKIQARLHRTVSIHSDRDILFIQVSYAEFEGNSLNCASEATELKMQFVHWEKVLGCTQLQK